MKNLIKMSLAVLTVGLAIQIAQAQNYKAPTIDASGKIYNRDGSHIGSVTKEGVISDAAGVKIGHVDGNGMLVDEKTGENLGKAEKNGNFAPHFGKTQDEGWSISAPMNGTCLVKDNAGNIKAEVHENYKAFGACAIHCLDHHMNHSDVLNKKTESAAYACPMHPDVTSDKAGKCSKCGMDLVKKNK
jgi:Heavy metal binding domain